jgi:hypothetical protein
MANALQKLLGRYREMANAIQKPLGRLREMADAIQKLLGRCRETADVIQPKQVLRPIWSPVRGYRSVFTTCSAPKTALKYCGRGKSTAICHCEERSNLRLLGSAAQPLWADEDCFVVAEPPPRNDKPQKTSGTVYLQPRVKHF